MEITKDEAYILYQGLCSLQESARSDEPHSAHTSEYSILRKKIKEYADIEGIINRKVYGKN